MNIPLDQLLDLALRLGATGVLAYITWALMTGRLVPRWAYDAMEAALRGDRDEWKGRFNRAATLAELVAAAGERKDAP